MKNLMLITLFSAFCAFSYAQLYVIPPYGEDTIQTCSGTITGQFADSAYTQYGHVTIFPDSENSVIKLTFDTIILNSCCSSITLYNGDNPSNPTLKNFTSTNYGLDSILSTSANGALHIRVRSNNSVHGDTFSFNVSCVSRDEIPSPDIELNAYNTNIGDIMAGDFVYSLSYILRNNSSYFQECKTEVYLSEDSIYDTEDIRVSTYASTNYLDAYEETKRNISAKIPSYTPPGDYFVLIIADPDDSISESNENNNTGIVPLTVLEADIELSVDYADNATILVPGVATEIPLRVNNDGLSPADSILITMYLSNDLVLDVHDSLVHSFKSKTLNNYYTNNLYPFVTINAASNWPVGPCFLITRVDANDRYSEENENDNVAYKTIVIDTPAVDLELRDIVVISPVVTGNKSFIQLTYKIPQGPYSNQLVFYISDDEILDTTSDSLVGLYSIIHSEVYEKIESDQFEITIPHLAEGSYTLFVKTLNDELYHEINPENNSIATSLEITAATCDIWIMSNEFYYKKLQAGKEYTFYPTFGSYGIAYYDSILTTCLLSQDTLIDDSDIEINRNDASWYYNNHFQQTISIPSDITPGNYYMIQNIKLNNDSIEYNEDNNTLYTPVEIIDADTTGNTDYQLHSFECQDTLMYNSFRINYSVFNDGVGSTDPIQTGFFLSKDTVLDATDQLLKIGDNLYTDYGYLDKRVESIRLPDGITPGDYTLFAKVDVSNQVDEANEFNNIKKQSIYIAEYLGRDWMCIGFDMKKIIYPGDYITQRYLITNYYVSDNKGKGEIIYSLTKNSSLADTVNPIYTDTIDVIFNSIFTESGCQIPDTISAGKYYLWAYHRPFIKASDMDSTNNLYMHELWVLNPENDLSISSLTTDKNHVTNSKCSFNLELSNHSSRTFDFVDIDLYLSEDNVLNKSSDILAKTFTIKNVFPGDSLKIVDELTMGQLRQMGEYHIFAYLDPEKYAGDINLSNNIDTALVYFIPTNIDYTIHSVESRDTLSYNSQSISRITVSNVGTEFINNDVYVANFLSEDTLLDSKDNLIFSLDNYIPQGYETQMNLGNYFNSGFCEADKWYYLIFKVDSKDAVSEISESNNIMYKKVYVQAPVTDISIDTINLTYSTTPGHPQNLRIDISNKGTMSASSHGIMAYLSTDSILDISQDTWLEFNKNDYYLGVNNTYTINYSPRIPSGQPYGDYYLFVMVDPLNMLQETDEINNVFCTSITVEQPVFNLSLPARLPHIELKTNGSTSGYISITNEGNYAVENTILNLWLSSDTLIGNDTLLTTETPYSYIEPGETISEHYYYTIPTGYDIGEYYILYAIKNLNDTIGDANVSDNICVQTLTLIYSSTDMVIDSCFISVNRLNSGSYLEVSCVVKNTGTENISSSTVGYLLSKDTIADESDYQLGTDYVGYLSNGQYSYESGYFYMPYGYAGTHYILFVADYYEAIQENNENNNILAKEIFIEHDGYFYDTTDYSISEASIKIISHPGSADSIRVAYKIERTESITDNITVEYMLTKSIDFNTYESGFFLYMDSINLDPYDEYISVYTTLPLPQHYTEYTSLTLIVNSNSDYYLSNNTHTINYNDTYDLQSYDALLYNSMATPGGIVSTVFTALNNGIETISNPEYGFYLSFDESWSSEDIYLGNYILQEINGNDSIHCSKSMLIPEVIQTGAYYFLIVSDYTKKISEDNESNNIEALPLQITNNVEHDLSITVDLNDPETQNDTLFFNGCLTNSGELHCNAITVIVYFSFDESLDNLDIPLDTLHIQDLGLNDTVCFTDMVVLPNGISQGDYHLIFKTTSKTESYDKNSENNFSPLPFKVGKHTTVYESIISKVNIYPNPAHDKLIIVQDEVGFIVNVFDIHGKLIMARNVETKKHELDITVLPAGSYILKILWKDKVITQKFIKE